MANFTLTNLFSTALSDHNFHFLARDTDGSLYAFKNEPYFQTSEWTDDSSDMFINDDTIDTRVSDWNMEHLIPSPQLVNYSWIHPGECIRL